MPCLFIFFDFHVHQQQCGLGVRQACTNKTPYGCGIRFCGWHSLEGPAPPTLMIGIKKLRKKCH